MEDIAFAQILPYIANPQSILISTILDTQSTAHACRRQVQ
jgi:hypothetical protein